MALTQYTESTDIILNLGKDPEDRPDLDDDGLAHKFDQNSENIVGWLNDTHLPEVQSRLDAKSDKYLGFKTITASKTFDLTDIDTVNVCDHASVPINLTIPPNSSVDFEIGSFLPAKWHGVAQVAFVAGAGVTIKPETKLKINAVGDYVGAVQRELNVWDLIGPTKA